MLVGDGGWGREGKGPELTTHPTITVLIRTFNEVASIGRALDLVLGQSLPPLEVVVVDSGSTDGTLDVVRDTRGVRLITIRPEDFTYGRSLNVGFEAARGDVVVLLSAHAFPSSRDWLEHLVRPFEDDRVVGVYGRQLAARDAWPLVRGDYDRYWGDLPRVQSDAAQRDDCRFSNANAAVRRRTWVTCGFDEQLPYAEDQEWVQRVLGLGHIVRYEPQAAVLHSHNESLIRLYRRTRQEYAADLRIFGVRRSLKDGIRYWWNAVRQDRAYVRQVGGSRRWIAWSPFYRLARTLGILRSSMS